MLTNSRDIIRRLQREGFEWKSVEGSHHKYIHRQKRRMVIVPHPKRDLPIGTGTVRSIYKSAGWEKD